MVRARRVACCTACRARSSDYANTHAPSLSHASAHASAAMLTYGRVDAPTHALVCGVRTRIAAQTRRGADPRARGPACFRERNDPSMGRCGHVFASVCMCMLMCMFMCMSMCMIFRKAPYARPWASAYQRAFACAGTSARTYMPLDARTDALAHAVPSCAHARMRERMYVTRRVCMQVCVRACLREWSYLCIDASMQLPNYTSTQLRMRVSSSCRSLRLYACACDA
jgi:hypothetical protein